MLSPFRHLLCTALNDVNIEKRRETWRSIGMPLYLSSLELFSRHFFSSPLCHLKKVIQFFCAVDLSALLVVHFAKAESAGEKGVTFRAISWDRENKETHFHVILAFFYLFFNPHTFISLSLSSSFSRLYASFRYPMANQTIGIIEWLRIMIRF